MFKICENMKINPDVDYSFITNPNHEKYMNTITNSVSCDESLKDKFPHTSNELLSLLEQML